MIKKLFKKINAKSKWKVYYKNSKNVIKSAKIVCDTEYNVPTEFNRIFGNAEIMGYHKTK